MTTLRDVVRQYVTKYPDTDRAVNACIRALDRNQELKQSIQNELLQRAVRAEVYLMRHQVRTEIKTPAPVAMVERDLGAAVSVVRQSILDSWNLGNKALGDCTKDDLLYYANRESESANGHLRNAAFYDMLAKLVDDEQVVRDAVDDEKANELLRKAQRTHRVGNVQTKTTKKSVAA